MLSKSVCTLILLLSSSITAAADFNLYTSMPTAKAEALIAAFEQKNPEIDVTLKRAGSTRTVLSIETEAATGDIQADVVMVADELNMKRLKKHGLLLADTNRDIAALPAGTFDPDLTFFGTHRMSVALCYNRQNATEPDSWAVLADAAPERAILTNPLTAGSALANLVHLEAVLGWDFLQKLAANRSRVMRKNSDVVAAIAAGDADYGVVLDYLATDEAARNPDFGVVYPREGVATMFQPIAILKDTDNLEEARRFVDFVLSRDGQEAFAALGYRPLYHDIPVADGFPPDDSILQSFVIHQKDDDSVSAFKTRFQVVFSTSIE
ncbi:MAG: extracellular solute-binding protein [Thalassovita sp.]|nr:extracellular solute-binding protein [Thalassovita sp.]